MTSGQIVGKMDTQKQLNVPLHGELTQLCLVKKTPTHFHISEMERVACWPRGHRSPSLDGSPGGHSAGEGGGLSAAGGSPGGSPAAAAGGDGDGAGGAAKGEAAKEEELEQFVQERPFGEQLNDLPGLCGVWH